MHTIKKTKLNYNKMSEMHNLAYEFNCMVKVKRAGEIARQAMGVGLAGHSGHSKLGEKAQSEQPHQKV